MKNPLQVEERLFRDLGDLGDPDGLYAFHQQEKVNVCNVAERLGVFWQALERNGISELARIELVTDYYSHLQEMEDLDASLQSPSFFDWDDDDD